MNINLRFGMHRDIPIIHSESAKIDGLVIPGHILAYQPAPTSVFVASMPGHHYIIDPMTFILQHEKSSNVNEVGELKRSIRRMCEEYHEELAGLIEGLSINQRMGPDDFPSLNDFCGGIVTFQRNVVREKSTTSKAAKYIRRYASQTHTEPRLIVAPYFKFESVRDRWYQFSLRCASETQGICNNDPIGVVIYCSPRNLNVESINQITEDYRQFSNVLIWLDDFNEMFVTEEDILEARRLINALAQGGAEVESLYGGYLLMLMESVGLTSISHGILYTQHKSFRILPGGGGVPERYYIPQFKGFRSLSQTDLILHQHTELICGCEICTEIMGDNPDNFLRFGDEPDLLRRHFMAVRRQEANAMESMDIEEEIEILRETYQTYNGSIQRLPNPDAFVSQSRMSGLEYLNKWADGIERAI